MESLDMDGAPFFPVWINTWQYSLMKNLRRLLFDEDWEKVVFRMCQKETFLSNRVFQVSGLLNKVAALVGNDAQLGQTIEAIIALSAVTNLKAFDTALRLTKFQRDQSDYRFNGKVYTKKTDLVRDVLLAYMAQHPAASKQEVHDAFRLKKNMETVFIDEKLYIEYWESDRKKLSFFKAKDKLREEDYIPVGDTRLLVTSNWPLTVNGAPALFSQFLGACKRLGFVVEGC